MAYKWFPDTFDDAQGWVRRFRFFFRLLGKCGVSVGAIPGAEAKQVSVTGLQDCSPLHACMVLMQLLRTCSAKHTNLVCLWALSQEPRVSG